MKRTWIWSVGSVGVGAAVVSVAVAFLGAFPRAASGQDAAAKPAYIGADGCKKCHMQQYKSWKTTPMANALEKLKPGQAADKKTAAKLDPNTDFSKDPKCVKCHVTGYGTETGYPAIVEGKAWTADEEARAKLTAGITCEACHGAGSLYAPFKTGDKKAYTKAEIAALGLVKPSAELCLACHKTGESPTMAPDYKFDYDAAIKKDDQLHKHIPLKEKHE